MTLLVQLPLMLALAASGITAPTISKTAVSSAPKILLDPCRTMKADTSTTLGPNEDAEVLKSIAANYAGANRSCKRFVADFNVLANASPADKHGVLDFDVGGGAVSQPTKATCESTEVWLTTYEKVVGSTNFVQRSSARYKGKWTTGMFEMCSLVRVSGTNPPSDQPNPAGTETWRVAVRADVNGSAVPVQARIGFKIIPW